MTYGAQNSLARFARSTRLRLYKRTIFDRDVYRNAPVFSPDSAERLRGNKKYFRPHFPFTAFTEKDASLGRNRSYKPRFARPFALYFLSPELTATSSFRRSSYRSRRSHLARLMAASHHFVARSCRHASLACGSSFTPTIGRRSLLGATQTSFGRCLGTSRSLRSRSARRRSRSALRALPRPLPTGAARSLAPSLRPSHLGLYERLRRRTPNTSRYESARPQAALSLRSIGSPASLSVVSSALRPRRSPSQAPSDTRLPSHAPNSAHALYLLQLGRPALERFFVAS